MAKLLILGGSPFQLPAIKHAVALGHHVITCDYLPQNPGHAVAKEYFNISTTDLDAVLALSRRLAIDGVLAFASDPAAPTAAYVASELGLPGSSPHAIHCLTDKPAFRSHLKRHGFNAPGFSEVGGVVEALEAADAVGFPVMVKPCDSSGTKGVSRVEHSDLMADAFHFALQQSRSKRVLVERWIARRGPQIAGDGLVIGARTVFGCFGDEHFDGRCSPYAPVGESFPGELDSSYRDELFVQLDRLFATLGVRDLVFNLDAMIDENGDLMFIEIGPRTGGNCLPQVIQEHTGVDLTDIAIRLALGVPVRRSSYTAEPKGFHASWMIHSRTDGRLLEYHVESELLPYLTELCFLVEPGTRVRKFSSSADTLGYARLAFPDAKIMASKLATMSTLLGVTTE